VDYSDLLWAKRQLLQVDDISMASKFDDPLWGQLPALSRSSEASPLYALRYAGTRMRHVPSHHDFWEVTVTLRGKGKIITPTQTLNMQRGSAVLLPPYLPHFEHSSEKLDTIWIGVSGKRFDARQSETVVHSILEDLCEVAERLWLKGLHRDALIGPELDGLTQQLCAILWRENFKQTVSGTLATIDHAAQLLRRRFATPISMTNLAASIHMSEGHFYRQFRLRFGVSPLEYLTDLRIEHAMRLLQCSTLTVQRIAQLVGYNDPQYFSRVFQRRMNRAPNSYRSTR